MIAQVGFLAERVSCLLQADAKTSNVLILTSILVSYVAATDVAWAQQLN
jgi:hypothetical protein